MKENRGGHDALLPNLVMGINLEMTHTCLYYIYKATDLVCSTLSIRGETRRKIVGRRGTG